MKKIWKFMCILLCVCMCLSAFAACSESAGKHPVIPTPTPTSTPVSTPTPTPTPAPTPVPEPFSEFHNRLSDVFADAPIASELLQILDSLIEDDVALGVEAYTEKLVTTLVTYDLQHAAAMAEQYKMDTIKMAKTYEMDLTKAESELVTRFVYRIGDEVSVAVESISRIEDPIHRMYVLSYLQTILENYTSYHSFLTAIATSITGPLQGAAEGLVETMKSPLQLFLQTDPYSEFFFTEPIFLTLKEKDAYTSDSNFKLFVDSALHALTTLEVSKAEPVTDAEAWKKGYLDWLKEDVSVSESDFALLHMNADDIPELYYGFEDMGGTLCSYTGNHVIKQAVNHLYYIEKKTFFLDSYGRMDYYYDTVYSLENGTFEVMHNGEFGYLDESSDANGERIYVYHWDAETVSEAEYKRRLNAAFDKEQATPYETSLSYEEVIEAIILY